MRISTLQQSTKQQKTETQNEPLILTKITFTIFFYLKIPLTDMKTFFQISNRASIKPNIHFLISQWFVRIRILQWICFILRIRVYLEISFINWKVTNKQKTVNTYFLNSFVWVKLCSDDVLKSLESLNGYDPETHNIL